VIYKLWVISQFHQDLLDKREFGVITSFQYHLCNNYTKKMLSMHIVSLKFDVNLKSPSRQSIYKKVIIELIKTLWGIIKSEALSFNQNPLNSFQSQRIAVMNNLGSHCNSTQKQIHITYQTKLKHSANIFNIFSTNTYKNTSSLI
jgi:hypothetical protein